MKTLYIVRHAKSSWKEKDIPDEERPLLEKGKKRTKKIIDHLHDRDVTINYLVTSHAVRALETAKMFARGLNYPTDKIRIDKRIYHSDAEGLMNEFFDMPQRHKSLMLVGHNPTLTNFVNRFVKPKIDWIPTSGVVCIEFDTDKWEEIIDAKSRLKFVIFPKMLP